MEHPHLKACPVFKDSSYKGLVLKKDLENLLNNGGSDISELIIKVSPDKLEDMVFYEIPNLKSEIPYITPSGKLMGRMKYNEFVSEFFPEDYTTKLSLKEIFDKLNHPVIILNSFKTVIYINSFAENILSGKIFGMKISDALISYEFAPSDGRLIIKRQGEKWHLLISQSKTPFALYYIYQMLPIEN